MVIHRCHVTWLYSDSSFRSHMTVTYSDLCPPIFHSTPPNSSHSPLHPSPPQFLAITVTLYALFEVLYKRLATRKDDTAPVMNGVRFLGYMGVHTLLWFWPLLIVFHFTGVEVFELPSLDNVALMTLNAFFDVIFNASLLVCIALSSPLFAR